MDDFDRAVLAAHAALQSVERTLLASRQRIAMLKRMELEIKIAQWDLQNTIYESELSSKMPEVAGPMP